MKNTVVEFIPADKIDEEKAVAEVQVIKREPWEGMLQGIEEGTVTEITLPPPKGKEAMVANMHNAFELLGGVPRMVVWANENYGEWMKIYGKLLPKQIDTDNTHDGTINIRHILPPTELDK